MLSWVLNGVVAISIIAAGNGFSSRSAANGLQGTAALPVGVKTGNVDVTLPEILPPTDAAFYRQIFELQKEGKWRAADALIGKISDDLLIGHVLYQRYMHPTKYRSRYVELKKWMAVYGDHPGAQRVYRLAMRRKPGNWRMPKRPIGISLGPLLPETADDASTNSSLKKRLGTRKQRRHARYVIRQIKSLVRRGRPTQALERLQRKSIRRGFHPVHYDRALAIVTRGYYHAKKDKKALRTAKPAIKRSGAEAPMALWWSGLAAFRSGKFVWAAENFERLAEAKLDDNWITSGAAYWAARANLAARNPSKVNRMLERAARHPRTFYGLVAARALGEPPVFEWELPRLGKSETKLLSQAPAARRALALIQVGETVRAERELKRFTGNLSPSLARILLGLTAKANLPALSYRLGQLLEMSGSYRYDAALFPLPNWLPKGGYRIDRAMIYALIRQESGFKPKAKSKAGARGLMQLMPRTAEFVADKHFRGQGRHALFEPEYNITLGQRYVGHLFKLPAIDNNLFYATVAYNGGPGNLSKWRRNSEYRDDPLLFIESIPSRETRAFVERVLTNFWVYRFRLGQPTPSLNAVAAGSWPRYQALDMGVKKVARRAD